MKSKRCFIILLINQLIFMIQFQFNDNQTFSLFIIHHRITNNFLFSNLLFRPIAIYEIEEQYGCQDHRKLRRHAREQRSIDLNNAVREIGRCTDYVRHLDRFFVPILTPIFRLFFQEVTTNYR